MRMKTIATLATAAVIAAASAVPAHALTIDFTTKTGDTLTNAQAAAFDLAAKAWSAILKNDVTLSIQVGFAALEHGTLGATSASFVSSPARNVADALRTSATSAADRQAVAFLNPASASSLTLTSAQAKALGLARASSQVPDGTIEFSSAYSFSEARDGYGQIAKGTYDLVGIAEHEIGHLLGFVSGLDFTPSAKTVLDLFRYGAAGQQSASIGAKAYFSVDGGRTPLAEFSDGWSDQASHWKDGTQWNGARALMDPEIGSGVVQNITPLDITALDVIGWNTTETRVSAVPLPPSAPLLAGALLMLGFAGRAAGTRDRLRSSGVATRRSASRTS